MYLSPVSLMYLFYLSGGCICAWCGHVCAHLASDEHSLHPGEAMYTVVKLPCTISFICHLLLHILSLPHCTLGSNRAHISHEFVWLWKRNRFG
ncbi:hypothetical protein GDO81_018324 [Engystomops pustulosus]|uniref:Secreted protein n=1 Tax=Engystomops pustulosus TaxID=76066 RepID=A0AAV7AAC3_ENGPU|nr:hypothetical protein GDO81_018324 [Engystomops pustulosus]